MASNQLQIKIIGLAVCCIVLFGVYFLFAKAGWQINENIHTLFETSATIIALFISVLLLASYITNKDRRFLFFGIGFLGTAILDANHAFATSSWLIHEHESIAATGTNWNWNSSRLFLSLLMFISCWKCIAQSSILKSKQLQTKYIYLLLSGLTAAVIILFTFFPVSNLYSDAFSVGRPIEIPPAIFFLGALFFYVQSGRWKSDIFEYWLVLFLLASLFYQALYMPSSKNLFDSSFIIAHLLKIVSYIFVFVGMTVRMYQRFNGSAENSEKVKRTNLELQKEIAEKKELGERMKSAALNLEDKVKERTHELEDARIAAFNMMEDANDAKKAAEEAKEKLDVQATKLAASNKELEQFAYVASHDLQEPLRTVGSFVQLLSQRYQGKLDQQADEYIQFIVEGVTRMRQLINDLLVFSRVETKGGKFAPVDFEMVLGEVLSNLKASIAESNAEITHDQMPMLYADKLQFSQLMQNLIGNAIKFKGDKPPKIHIAAKKQDDQWLFSVKDNGIGFEPEFSDKIFVIFQRLHTRSEYPGTGIGLSLCKKIVERHGGKIWVDSSPGRGSTFNFTIPDKMGEQNEYSSFEQANRNSVG